MCPKHIFAFLRRMRTYSLETIIAVTRQAKKKPKQYKDPYKKIWDKILQISSKANGRYTNPTVKI